MSGLPGQPSQPGQIIYQPVVQISQPVDLYVVRRSTTESSIFWVLMAVVLITFFVFWVWYLTVRDEGRTIGSSCGQTDQCQNNLRCVDGICQPVVRIVQIN